MSGTPRAPQSPQSPPRPRVGLGQDAAAFPLQPLLDHGRPETITREECVLPPRPVCARPPARARRARRAAWRGARR